jgi:uncharacterized membrane protein (DUF485 family)
MAHKRLINDHEKFKHSTFYFMSPVALLVSLILLGLLVWFVKVYLPTDKKTKAMVNIVVVICVAFRILYAFAITAPGSETNHTDSHAQAQLATAK